VICSPFTTSTFSDFVVLGDLIRVDAPTCCSYRSTILPLLPFRFFLFRFYYWTTTVYLHFTLPAFLHFLPTTHTAYRYTSTIRTVRRPFPCLGTVAFRSPHLHFIHVVLIYIFYHRDLFVWNWYRFISFYRYIRFHFVPFTVFHWNTIHDTTISMPFRYVLHDTILFDDWLRPDTIGLHLFYPFVHHSIDSFLLPFIPPPYYHFDSIHSDFDYIPFLTIRFHWYLNSPSYSVEFLLPFTFLHVLFAFFIYKILPIDRSRCISSALPSPYIRRHSLPCRYTCIYIVSYWIHFVLHLQWKIILQITTTISSDHSIVVHSTIRPFCSFTICVLRWYMTLYIHTHLIQIPRFCSHFDNCDTIHRYLHHLPTICSDTHHLHFWFYHRDVCCGIPICYLPHLPPGRSFTLHITTILIPLFIIIRFVLVFHLIHSTFCSTITFIVPYDVCCSGTFLLHSLFIRPDLGILAIQTISTQATVTDHHYNRIHFYHFVHSTDTIPYRIHGLIPPVVYAYLLPRRHFTRFRLFVVPTTTTFEFLPFYFRHSVVSCLFAICSISTISVCSFCSYHCSDPVYVSPTPIFIRYISMGDHLHLFLFRWYTWPFLIIRYAGFCVHWYIFLRYRSPRCGAPYHYISVLSTLTTATSDAFRFYR